ncbi:putative cell shape-determining protein [Paratrimastix pyriformis]|uniref:Cell shape-determining protein n=1 Tax=Paratrimastix pyriformis TaxID=342808 RepID=A0ABQ8U7S4_9EUKA|nr:putative cell shape-determining protein [Paratrimastix pyriformis]
MCGQRFDSPTVQVAGQACPLVLANSSCVACRSAGGLAGGSYVAVTLTNSNGLANTQNNLLWYQGAVTISSITPRTALQAGGTTASLTLTGTGFATGATCPTVTVGGQPCVVTACPSATSLACTLAVGPAGAANGPAAVVVTNPSPDVAICTQEGGFTFYGPAPTLTGLSPNVGPLAGGQTVRLQGTGLRVDAATGARPTVLVGGRPCTGVVADPAGSTDATGLTCTLPAGATLGSVNVVVTNWDQTAATLARGYAYQGATPTVSFRSPASGPATGGTALTLVGTDFRAGVTVTVAGSPCTLTASNGTVLRCTAPAGLAGSTAAVVVANSDGTSAAAPDFAYYAVGLSPVISRVSPSSTSQSNSVGLSVTGANFRAGLTLTVGGLICPNPIVTASRIRCTLPAPGPSRYGSVVVVVVNTDGTTCKLANGFTITGKAPVVKGVSPTKFSLKSAAANDRTTVTLTVTGEGFQTGAVVTLGNQTCDSPVVESTGTSLTCTLSIAGLVTAGPAAVVVTNADGLTSANPSSNDTAAASVPTFYFQGDAPTLSALTPARGPCNLGTPIVLQGANFRAGVTVWVGGVSCLNTSLLSSDSLACLVPPAASTVAAQLAESASVDAGVAVDVVVRNDDLTEATTSQAFVYTAALYPGGATLSAAATALIAVGVSFFALLLCGLLAVFLVWRLGSASSPRNEHEHEEEPTTTTEQQI